MIPLTLTDVADATKGRLEPAVEDPAGLEERRIEDVSTDSRTMNEGALFVALLGENADGHDFASDAVEAGASALLVERRLDLDVPQIVVDDTWDAIADLAAEVRRRVDPTVVAITGSVGKTTTKDLTACAVGSGQETVAATGSFNNELGVPLTLLSLTETTEALVTELGSRGLGHIAALTPLVRPDVGIVTRVAGVHLELFGDLETIKRAKAELVAALPPSGHAILNADDDRVAAMASQTAASVVRYGMAGADRASGAVADVEARSVHLDARARPTFEAATPWGRVEVSLPVAGVHNVPNALAALAVAGVLGVDIGDAAEALADAPVSQWRGEVLDANGVTILNDAYNSNPTAVAAAVDTLLAIEHEGASWVVLGVMAEIGPEHDAEHRRVGKLVAESRADHLVVVGEDAAAMADGAREAGMEQVTTVADAGEALHHVSEELVSGDAVLVKASRVAGLEKVAAGLADRREDST